MQYRIALQSLLIAEMINLTIECISKNTQVTNAERLKQQPHGMEVTQQIISDLIPMRL